MAISPYLNFAGNCREAVEYYAKVFKTEPPKFMTFGEGPSSPDYPMPEEAKNLIMHSRLIISDTEVMFSDTWPGAPFTVGNNISLTIWTKDRDELMNAWNALREGGTVNMELQETFWSKMYGDLTDKYGVSWLFNLDSGETF